MEISETTANFKQYLMRRYGDRSTPKSLSERSARLFLTPRRQAHLEATKADIDSFVDEQHKRGLWPAPTTINRRLATLHTFFEYTAGHLTTPGPTPSIGGSIRSRKATPCLETLRTPT